jgi:hypothetical protein
MIGARSSSTRRELDPIIFSKYFTDNSSSRSQFYSLFIQSHEPDQMIGARSSSTMRELEPIISSKYSRAPIVHPEKNLSILIIIHPQGARLTPLSS